MEMIVERYFMHAWLLLEFVRWKKISLMFNCLVSLTVFFSQAFITNKLKGCLCLGGEVRICALAIKADNPALQCQQERFNSFSHKSNFTFLWRGSLLSLLPFPLPLLCRHPWPPCRTGGGGRIPRTLRVRTGRVTWTFHAQGVTVSWSPSPLFCYCLTYLQLCQLGEDIPHSWCFLTHMSNISKICSSIWEDVIIAEVSLAQHT